MDATTIMNGVRLLVLTFTLVVTTSNTRIKDTNGSDVTEVDANQLSALKLYFPNYTWSTDKDGVTTGQKRSEDSSDEDDSCDDDSDEQGGGDEPSQMQKKTVMAPVVPRIGSFPHYRQQDDLDLWLEFKKTLGPRAEFVFNDAGYVDGIRLRIEALGNGGLPEYRLSGIRGDQDQCCTTTEMYHRNTSMMDINNRWQNIKQSSTSPQFIRHGICGTTGFCRGRCVQAYINLCILTYASPMCKFFQVPGYCACKNFGR